jgi:serine/threonine-protein kinase
VQDVVQRGFRVAQPDDELAIGFALAEDDVHGLRFSPMKGPAVDALTPGALLDGRYRIEEEIARGGMGVIYRAIHVTLDLPRAVKLITPQFARDPRYLERFRTEATAAARIEHPNVVTVHDFGEVDGAPYLVMQYVEGVDLERLVEREGPLMPQRALALLTQIADGLDAAHAVGVVHRDVKPSNILVVGDRALLTDFGLAKTTASRGQSELIGGTVEYAAPEQLEGADVDARTDVYSLGCVFLFMLTGRTPGIGHLWGDRPAADIPLPPTIEAVIARARARDPQERYGSAGETARAAIEEARRLANATTRPTTAPGTRGRDGEPLREPATPARGRRAAPYDAEAPTERLGASETRLRPRREFAPRHTIEDEPEPTWWERRRAWVLGLVALLLIGVAVAVGAVLAGGGDKPKPTPTPTPSPTPTATPSPTETPTPSPVPTETPTAVPTETPTATPEPESAEVERAIRRHWRALENGNYAAAYARFAPNLQNAEGRARWINAQRRDQLVDAQLEVEPRITSATTATARVVRLRTDAVRSGCHEWSGTYELRKLGGAWRISKAGLRSRKC